MGNRTMTEELEQLLKNLKLRRILEIYDEQLRAAEQKISVTRSSSRAWCARSFRPGRRERAKLRLTPSAPETRIGRLEGTEPHAFYLADASLCPDRSVVGRATLN